MNFQTTRFGLIEVDETNVIHFPEGLYGFEGEEKFALLPFDPNVECPLQWMQSLQTPDLAFVVTNPFIYKPDYKLNLTDDDKKRIGVEEDDTISVLVIVKIPSEFVNMTANLIAPLVVNNRNLVCKQFVMTTLEYDTQHYLLPEELRENTAAVGSA